MSKRNSAFLNAVNIAQKEKIQKCVMITRMQTLDKVTITLGQMGMNPDDLAFFEDEFCKVEHDYCDEILEDAECDKSIVYAKDKIDRALKQYVREDRFEPYDVRYRF